MRLADLFTYCDASVAARGSALDELTREAVALGTYDSTADDYRDAFERARRQRPEAAG